MSLNTGARLNRFDCTWSKWMYAHNKHTPCNYIADSKQIHTTLFPPRISSVLMGHLRCSNIYWNNHRLTQVQCYLLYVCVPMAMVHYHILYHIWLWNHRRRQPWWSRGEWWTEGCRHMETLARESQPGCKQKETRYSNQDETTVRENTSTAASPNKLCSQVSCRSSVFISKSKFLKLQNCGSFWSLCGWLLFQESMSSTGPCLWCRSFVLVTCLLVPMSWSVWRMA